MFLKRPQVLRALHTRSQLLGNYDTEVLEWGEQPMESLKRFKEEVKDVPMGQECGMAFERYEDIRPGDVIEIFERESIERTLE